MAVSEAKAEAARIKAEYVSAKEGYDVEKQSGAVGTEALQCRRQQLAQRPATFDAEENKDDDDLYMLIPLRSQTSIATARIAPPRAKGQTLQDRAPAVQDEEENPTNTDDHNNEALDSVYHANLKNTRASIGGGRPDNFTFIGAKQYSYLPWCTTIVLSATGVWVELRCCQCAGNVSLSTNGLMRGAGAMHGHLTQSQDFEPINMIEVLL
ncbi:hypothetical protein LTR08_004821 [Meristemomyces frigidus]|nr:hypothetical protein LTR08_004821 [Meristemomyces frigidus]